MELSRSDIDALIEFRKSRDTYYKLAGESQAVRVNFRSDFNRLLGIADAEVADVVSKAIRFAPATLELERESALAEMALYELAIKLEAEQTK